MIFLFLDELNEFIEELREYTEEAMKIEMAPWVQNYTLPMDELYTELTLEQIESKPTGPIPVKLESYTELFTEKETTDQQQCHPDPNPEPPRKKSRKSKGKKILAKGDPGMGKSTMGRKIAYDWAKGVFTAVSIVFFISMKLIRPGQSIENIIIDQVPPLEALEIGERKLKAILNKFGDKCLIIFDGLDEHELGSSEDVRKIIEGRKLLTCGVLLTSRPHDTEVIEKYFPTHVSIKGFSRDHASQFISRCVEDSEKAKSVLNFCTINFPCQFPTPVCFSHMLIMFLTILVKSDELDLTLRKSIPVSEIYFRLVRCIYRKYCERAKIEFRDSQFFNVLKQVGKFAWKMWKSGKGWAKKSEILKEVGEDAFDIGFLIGDKDFRLSGHETADVVITFPHLNLLEFLGSFGFLQSLNEGQSIESLLSDGLKGQNMLGKSIFLRFCLWFLNEGNGHFKYSRRQGILDFLTSHCANQMNFVQLDMMDIGRLFPVLKVPYTCSEENFPLFDFIRGILSKCSGTVEFYLPAISNYPVDYLSKLIPNLPPHSLQPENQINTKLCTILETAFNQVRLQKYSNCCDAIGLHPSFFICCHSDTDLSKMMLQSAKQLSLCGPRKGVCKVLVKQELSLYPFLEELSFVNLRVDFSVLVALETAVRTGKLPLLRHLSFEGCGPSLKGNLHTLFNSTWPLLTCLNLDKCSLSSSDLATLKDCLLVNTSRKLPKLTLLVLCAREEGLRNILQMSLQNINTLTLHDVDRDDYECVATAINAGKVPNLTHLNISFLEISNEIPDSTEELIRTSLDFPPLNHLSLNRFVTSPANAHNVALSARNSEVTKLDISHSSGLTGILSVMLREHFPFLTNLVVSDCGLNLDDLKSLAEASSEGRLSELKHLDLSDNEAISGQCRHLFSFGQKWTGLLSLNVKQATGAVPSNAFNDLVHASRAGGLMNLQSLTLSENNNSLYVSTQGNVRWPSARLLHVHCSHRHGSSDHFQLYQQITELLEKEMFPNLNTFSITSQIIPKHAVSRATDYVSVSDLREASIEAVYLQELRDISSSQITTHLSNEESHLKYMRGLTDVNSALDNTFEKKFSYFMTKFFRAFSEVDMVGNLLFAEVSRSLEDEWLDFCDISDKERSCLKSLGDVTRANIQAFVSGKPVDTQPVCSSLQDWIDNFPNISELDLSLLKSLAEIGYKNLELALNGQPLDLQPVCPLLRDYVVASPDKDDSFRSLLKPVVDAVESVFIGSLSNFKSASTEIYQGIEKVSHSSNFSASVCSQLKFITDVFCTFLNCFFTEPLDLHPVIDWLHSNEFEIFQSPEAQFIFKFDVDVICTLVEYFCKEKSNTDPFIAMVSKWFETIPDLLESNPTISKEFAFIVHTTIQHFLVKSLCIFAESADPGLFLANSRMSEGVQEYAMKWYSTQVIHQRNLNKLRDLRHRLRKRGIRVYEHYIPVKK